ncbi:MAG: MarR family transcriptional regulator [Bacteriovoracaceae bacterium]|nr:MarR family transcriptional regulator [Bacteriovoracaceae bacterium]
MPDDFEYAKEILETIPFLMRSIRSTMRGIAKSDLTVPQFRILNHISKAPLINRDLSDWMGVAAPTMTRMVDPLVKRGLIIRSEGRDRRENILKLTKLGILKTDAIRKVMRNKLVARLKKVRPSEKNKLSSSLKVLREVLAG